MSRPFAPLTQETFELRGEKENLFMISSEYRDGLCFDSVAENYDRYRPGYCEALFQAIAAYANLPCGANVLEVGCGTGKATLPLLRLGCSVTALEPGDSLASVARRNCAAFQKLRLLPVRFEEFDGEGGPFDLICSATRVSLDSGGDGVSETCRSAEAGRLRCFVLEYPVSGPR